MRPTGPVPARIAVIGEAPGAEEALQGLPFVGPSGNLLNTLLQKVGLMRNSCWVSNVCNHHPPGGDISEWISDRKTPPGPDWRRINDKWAHPFVAQGLSKLLDELSEVKPDVILALGNTALWALTGNSGISKWRGSRLAWGNAIVVPSIHPAAALRDPALSSIILMDFKRALALLEGRQKPRQYSFLINPTFAQARNALTELLEKASNSPDKLLLSADLETRRYHIACIGIADSPETAFCIPFLELNKTNPFYWPFEEEATLTHLLIQLLSHPNILWVGQNFLYDCQYFYRFWGITPSQPWDTMIGHHSIYSNMRKGLDFLSSMYSHDHVYWKDEIKEWDEAIGEKQYWAYNCKDACITLEVWRKIVAEQLNQAVSEHFYFQQSLFDPVLRIMNRGIRLDTTQRAELQSALLKLAREREDQLTYMAGHEINPRSSAQLQKFFYKDLGLPGIRSSVTDTFTLNSPALAQIAEKNPVLQPLCQVIAELRSIGVFLSTFINADLDSDGRMRCSFNIAGPITFRFSSSENAFGSGMNLQNVPVAEKEKVKGGEYVKLPNIRKLFIPDPGYTFFDLDLDRADLQCVVWEADDTELKQALRLGLDLHCLNACTIFDIQGIPFEELTETHPNYHDHRGRIGKPNRDKAKMGVHATNYGVGDYKLAVSLGITQREAGVFRARWFSAHPGIKQWHLRTEEQARKWGFVSNPFGAKLNILGRFDLPECLAWQPQSTVAGVINRGLRNIDAAEQVGQTSTQLLGQVHDSLFGQFLTCKKVEEITNLHRLTRIEVPYPDPLIIPIGVKTSAVSWGDCK